jgi:hypothetical protein
VRTRFLPRPGVGRGGDLLPRPEPEVRRGGNLLPKPEHESSEAELPVVPEAELGG